MIRLSLTHRVTIYLERLVFNQEEVFFMRGVKRGEAVCCLRDDPALLGWGHLLSGG